MNEQLKPHGFFAAPLNLSWYNDILRENATLSRFVIPEAEGTLALLCGNSRAAWPHFSAWCAARLNGSALKRSNGDCAAEADALLRRLGTDPFEDFSREVIGAAASFACARARNSDGRQLGGSPALETPTSRWATYTEEASELLAAQHMARAAAIAFLDVESYLCVHRQLGPWFALRGALIFGDVEGPSQRERLRNFATPKDPLDEAARQRVRSAMELAVSVAGDYSGGLDASGKGGAVMDGRWRHWLAVRDAVAPQHPERYSERQIEYHYTKDRGVLLELAASFQSQSRYQSQSHG